MRAFVMSGGPVITTTPGFSSRSTDTHVTQLPQRDEEAMSEQEPGWSNGPAAEDEKAAQKAHDAQTYATSLEVEAGFSNSAPDSPAATGELVNSGPGVKWAAPAEADSEPVKQAEADAAVDPAPKKPAAKKAPAKKTATKRATKTAAKKG